MSHDQAADPASAGDPRGKSPRRAVGHLVKEDGSQAQLGEELDFKVIEFNKDAKRIILSHSRIFEDAARAEAREQRKAAAAAKKATRPQKEQGPSIQNKAASQTLGDIDALAALKAEMENKK